MQALVLFSNGDARIALNTLELAVQSTRPDEKGIRKGLGPERLKTRLSAVRRSMTSPAISTTTRYPPSSSRCEAPTRMPHYTIWPA